MCPGRLVQSLNCKVDQNRVNMHIQLEFPNGTETGWKVGLELQCFLMKQGPTHQTPNITDMRLIITIFMNQKLNFTALVWIVHMQISINMDTISMYRYAEEDLDKRACTEHGSLPHA